ncbi:MAG: hypothetical protein ACYSO4_06085 [Planctomycetota bacterium]
MCQTINLLKSKHSIATCATDIQPITPKVTAELMVKLKLATEAVDRQL